MAVIVAATFWQCTAALAAPIVNDDAAAQFSISGNPNGNWSYGYKDTLTSAFIPYAYSTSQPVNDGNWLSWGAGPGDWISMGLPLIYKNASSGEAQNWWINPTPGGVMAGHPGPEGQFSVLRWTAPGAGTYDIASWFAGGDGWGTTTDVHVQLNGTALFNALVNGGSGESLQTYSTILALDAGSVFDFSIGYGVDNFYGNDATRFNAVITSQDVPEPATLALLAAGLLLLVSKGRCGGRLRLST